MTVLKNKKIASRTDVGQLLVYVLLIAFTVINIFPFYWTMTAGFRPVQDILSVPPVLFSTKFTLENFVEVFRARVDLFYLNSIIQVTLAVSGVLFTSSLGGFIFAKFEFRGKEALFKAILATMMVPFAVLIIPMVVIASRLHLVNNMAGLVLPFLVSPFGMYLMRQFIETIPNDLLDAARMDGASNWQIYWRVILPLSRPALGTVSIFFFIANWNNLLWPLVTMYDQGKWTMPVALAQFGGGAFGSQRYGPAVAAAALLTAPLVLVYTIFQRQIVRSIAMTGIK